MNERQKWYSNGKISGYRSSMEYRHINRYSTKPFKSQTKRSMREDGIPSMWRNKWIDEEKLGQLFQGKKT